MYIHNEDIWRQTYVPTQKYTYFIIIIITIISINIIIIIVMHAVTALWALCLCQNMDVHNQTHRYMFNMFLASLCASYT